MKTSLFDIMTVDQLKRYMHSTPEKEYLLVDVRQPGEYMQTHIPGALLMPLSDLKTKLSSLPADRDIVFYCLAGSRSRTAAVMAADQKKDSQKRIYSLEGGISQWTGASIDKIPKIQIFDKSHTIPQLLETAVRMEKGARVLYEKLNEINLLNSGGDIFSQLAEAEMSHARTLFGLIEKYSDAPLQSFDEFFNALPDDMVEGGDAVDDLVGYIHSIQKYGCINLLDLAMDVEFVSYDLYKTLANLKIGEGDAERILLGIAQAEKNHMSMIADSYEHCRMAEKA
ncbi:MAG: rhodanese-like domain-containing protein [Desulfobacterales bacterium]|jgi:rhodanese-related sulfurtransferase|nr:rhodanese-like domain-containing protein [Desulfobacterales bacterium]